jgi:hypothetical protein
MKVDDRVEVTGVQEVEYHQAGIGSKGTVSCVFSDRLCEVTIDNGCKLNFWNTELTEMSDD